MTQHALPSRRPDHAVAPMFPARWSPRAFAATPLSEAEVMTLVEAARWAPSAANRQPWRLVWALRGEAGFAAIAAALNPTNRIWADKAAVLIALASKDTSPDAGGSEVANHWSAFDTGAAWASLALQAEAMGLAAHAMGGFDPAALAAAVGLPDGHTLRAVVAAGHRGATADLPEALRAREVPSPRRPLAEIAFRGRFPAAR
ncbi:MAG: nitroreductase family protein [Rhodobacteraceae bacterium]|jgi:nitroreductase|nr:nitroreductase family protein [Paracoccaceae bacterium]